MLKKLKQRLKVFLKPPGLPEINPTLEASMFTIDRLTDREKKHMNNMENLAVYNLKLQREASQHQLNIQHWTMVVALAAVILSAITSAVAIVVSLHHHPDVVVKLVQSKK